MKNKGQKLDDDRSFKRQKQDIFHRKRSGFKPVVFGILFTFVALVNRVEALTFEAGDKVVLLGNTFIERAQKFGYLELALTLSSRQKKVKFRNLGWSGDSVFCHARSYFGPPSEGFSRLEKDLQRLDPDVVILCYGSGAAFETESTIQEFIEGYTKLIRMVKQSADPRELILLTPPVAESMNLPMPDMRPYNQRLAKYVDEIAKMASEQQVGFADLYQAMGTPVKGSTDNGLHYNETGYRSLVPSLVKAMNLKLNFKLISRPQAEQLRKIILKKNSLFFQQWRPANETYLRLFRKHEQGKNVKELPLFDALILEQERLIEEVKIQLNQD